CGYSLPRRLHPSRCHIRSPPRFLGGGQGHVSLARLRSQQEATPDAACRRVPASLLTACFAARIRPYPTLRFPRQPPPRHAASALPATSLSPAPAPSPPTITPPWYANPASPSLDMPTVRRSHASRRALYRRSDQTPFST